MANVFTRFFRRALIPSLLKDVLGEIRTRFARLEATVQNLAATFGNQAATLGNKVDGVRDAMDVRFAQTAAALERIEARLAPADPAAAFANLDRASAQYRADNPELDLMLHLYAFLPSRNSIDIGANVGDVAEHLLDAGFSVHAFEPFPPVFEKLRLRLGHYADFHPAQMAIGSKDADMELSIATDPLEGKYGDPTVYNTLLPRETSGDLVFPERVPVRVRSLESLHKSGEIPADIGLVKIDTEGYELEGIRGMGAHSYPVVCAEFWAKDFTFGRAGSLNHLEDMVPEMRQRGYHWNLIVCRVEGVEGIACYLNTMRTPPKAWGNIFFFHEAALFQRAMEWHAHRQILMK